MKLREYYMQTYPSDDLGTEINPDATFMGLIGVMISREENVYEYMGVEDSIVRERIFDKLSELLGIDYDCVYHLWLYGAPSFK